MNQHQFRNLFHRKMRDKSTLNSIKMKAEQEGQLATEAAQEAEGGAGGVTLPFIPRWEDS